MTSRGATAKSCNNRMDRPAIPSFRLSHFFSFKTGRTNADEDNAPADEIQNASTGDDKIGLNNVSSRGIPMAATTCKIKGPPKIVPKKNKAMDNTNWNIPNVEKVVNFLIRSGDNAKPSLNSKNNIPKSPSVRSASVLSNKSIPYGPIAHPTAKKPKTGDILRALESGTTATVDIKKINISRPKDANSASSPAPGGKVGLIISAMLPTVSMGFVIISMGFVTSAGARLLISTDAIALPIISINSGWADNDVDVVVSVGLICVLLVAVRALNESADDEKEENEFSCLYFMFCEKDDILRFS
mmetsp:Transcript_12650/g.17954  ORF Transcript_12650/g.17954 Transcript_12650/m.17954 type:complete len:300 (-) Transcript_12650:116-1015(-)